MAKCVVEAASPNIYDSIQVNAETAARPEVSKKNRLVHDIQKNEDFHSLEREKHDRSFDSANINYLHLDNVKSVIFTKLGSIISHKHGVYNWKL